MEPSGDLTEASTITLQKLSALYSVIASSAGLKASRLSIGDVFERFELWASNIGALRSQSDQRSLEHRVRAAPKLRQRFLEVLSDLREDLADCKLKFRFPTHSDASVQ